MSCPDWRRLDPAWRDLPGAPAAAWEDALRHLDGGCSRCRQEALAIDPTLVFRRLPVPDLGPSAESDEVAAACLAVAAMRTASRLQHHGRPGFSPAAMLGGGAHDARGASGAIAGRAAALASRFDRLRLPHAPHAARQLHLARRGLAAAALTALALLIGSSHGWRGAPGHAAGRESSAAAAAAGLPALAGSPSRGLARSAAAWEGAPEVLPAAARSSIEGLSRPEARVYQLDGPHMSVVMIVDDKLDV